MSRLIGMNTVVMMDKLKETKKMDKSCKNCTLWYNRQRCLNYQKRTMTG